MAKISEIASIQNNYFEDCKYVSITDLLNKQIEITDVKMFINREGQDSIAIRFEWPGDIGGEVCRTVTHAKAVIDLLATEEVRKILDSGETIEGCLVQKKSKQSGRNYITIQ